MHTCHIYIVYTGADNTIRNNEKHNNKLCSMCAHTYLNGRHWQPSAMQWTLTYPDRSQKPERERRYDSHVKGGWVMRQSCEGRVGHVTVM